MRPMLFLDVDGVLSIFPGDLPGLLHHEDEDRLPFSTWPDLPQHLASLATVFDCVWATAWYDSAPRAFAPLFAPCASWPVLPPWRNVKLDLIPDFATGHPWAFVDDEAGWELEETSLEVGENLVLSVDGRQGLQAAHVERPLAFARLHA